MRSWNSVFDHWVFHWEETARSVPRGTGWCLDLGCGGGRHRGCIEEAGWSWLGLDTDAARGGASVVGSALCMPLADEGFDLVMLWQVLEHLPEPSSALSEVSRVLKTGGHVIGSASCMEPFHDVASYYGFTHKGLEQALACHGFAEIQIRPGLNAFSLIARSWFRQLIGASWGEVVAFSIVRVSFVTLVSAYLLLRWFWNVIRRGTIGTDYHDTVGWLAHDAPLQFAGHLQFRATKVTPCINGKLTSPPAAG